MKRLPLTTALSAALAAAFLAGAAHAQPAANSSTKTTPSPMERVASAAERNDKAVARADAAFMKQAAQNGHAEVEGSKLALTKASSEKVKTFAQQMIDDHTKANAELMELAKAKGVELPTEPSLMQKGKQKLLEQSDGADFDRRYAETLGVKAHEDTIKLFRKGAKEAKDADVKAFAEKTLPKLEHHLEMARELHAAVGGKSEGKSGHSSKGERSDKNK